MKSLYFLNQEFQVSNHLLWLYSPVCVGPGRKPLRPVFSQGGSVCALRLGKTHIIVGIHIEHKRIVADDSSQAPLGLAHAGT